MMDKIIQVSGFGVQGKDYDYLLTAVTEDGRILISCGDSRWTDVSPQGAPGDE